MIQNGLITKWKRDNWPREKLCGENTGHRPATLQDTQGVFYILPALLMLASLILAGEVILHETQKFLVSKGIDLTTGSIKENIHLIFSAFSWMAGEREILKD